MRRPLFMVCLCLVIVASLRLGWQRQCSNSQVNLQELNGDTIYFTGRVYQKDSQYFYLESLYGDSINSEQNHLEQNHSENSISEQEAAYQQPTIPLSNHTMNIMCEYDNLTYACANEAAVRIGSTVTVCGTFYTFDRATNPGEFDVAAYYDSLKIGGKLRSVTVYKVSEAYSVWQEALFTVLEAFRERLYYVFPEKEASVMSTMLLGDKTDLDREIKGLYQRNGIVHILSISGLHITIIGMSVYKLLRKVGLPVWLAAVCGGMTLLLYGVMTGMSVSACRAIGMYLLRMLGEVIGRTYDMLTALGIMAAVMAWNNPEYLINAGFQLSFGAVLGIGVLYPVLLSAMGNVFGEKENQAQRYEGRRWKQLWCKIIRKFGNGLKQSMLSSMAVTLTTLPILLWFYYEVPVYSMFLNLLILPFMSALMLSGLLAMLVPGLGILGTVTCAILHGCEFLCRLFEGFPFHIWNPGRPELWQVVVYYGILLGAVMVYDFKSTEHGKKEGKGGSKKEYSEKECSKKKCHKKLRAGALALLLTTSVIIISLRLPQGTTITFLDVGQGDCICIQTASGEVYLFDCGSSSRSKVGEYVLKPYLKYKGINHIDGVFVSHPDSDHCNGVLELLESGEEWGITVGKLVLPEVEMLVLPEVEERSELAELTELEKYATVEIDYIGAGEGWQCEEMAVECLHPPIGNNSLDSNAYSQCFYVTFGAEKGMESQAFSLLLTGDVEGEGEELLLQELQKRQLTDITLLKVAHHGSKNSTSAELLAQIKPQTAVISCGKNNRYGHPHRETLERLQNVGSRILATADYGAITVEIKDNVLVYGYKYDN